MFKAHQPTSYDNFLTLLTLFDATLPQTRFRTGSAKSTPKLKRKNRKAAKAARKARRI